MTLHPAHLKSKAGWLWTQQAERPQDLGPKRQLLPKTILSFASFPSYTQTRGPVCVWGGGVVEQGCISLAEGASTA